MRAAIGITSTLALCPRRGGVAEAQRFRHHVLRSAFCAMGAMLLGLPGTPAQGQCTPQEQAKLIASDAATDDYFGFSVAVSGDTAVIGAYSDEHAGGISDGSAYIFVRSGPPGSEVWTQQAKLTAPDAAANDQFGNSVAISGDTVLIGSHFDDHVVDMDLLVDAGSAYVFVRSGVTWTQQAKLIASDTAVLDDFGFSVSVSGDTAVIGARTNDIPGAANGGSAYVFVRAGTVWAQQAMLTASDAGSSDQFGWSVAVSGDTAAVGAHYDEHSGFTDPGSAYIFTRSGTVWTQQAKLIASDAGEGDEFGRSIALSGDTAVVGAYQDIYAGGANAAYVFVRSGPPGSVVWTQQAKLIASDAAVEDFFGVSVAISGDTAVVGAFAADTPAGGEDAGSAYVFDLTGCGPSCLGDLDGSGSVTGLDLASLLGQWSGAATYSPCPPHKPQDLNQDCKVNGLDLALLLGAWGPCP